MNPKTIKGITITNPKAYGHIVRALRKKEEMRMETWVISRD